jgi:hypothetical protein
MALGLVVAACGDPTQSTGTEPDTSVAPDSTSPTTEPPTFTTFPAATTTTVAPSTTTAAVMDPRLTFEPLDLPALDCDAEGRCLVVLATRSGRLATVQTAEPVITFVDDGGSLTVDVGAEWFAWPVMFGPEDVLYLTLVDRASGESGGMIAVATSGPRAGSTVASSTVFLDTSGDSSIVATAAGLVEVPCCGNPGSQPSPDEELVMGWASAAGGALPMLTTDVWIEYAADDTATVVRSDAGVERRWTLDGRVGGRDMPLVVATDDGGVLLWQYDGLGAPELAPVLYEGRPDGSVDQFELPGFNYPNAMNADRSLVLYAADSGYVRTQLP